MEALQEKLQEIARNAASAIGVTLDRVEYKPAGRNSVVLVIIHREEGTKIRDCELVSRAVEQELDAAVLIPGHYSIEVRSRGVGDSP